MNLNTSNMPLVLPLLRPIPILTKNKIFPLKILIWIFSVRKWEVAEDWSYTLSCGTSIKIPKGFEFDGASIPRPLWIILSPVGLLFIPGLIHDYAYKYQHLELTIPNGGATKFGEGKGRLYWDALFRKEAIHVNGFALIDVLAWCALVAFGWVAWHKHRKAQ